MAEKGRILTGARVRFSIEGIKVGYARNVTLGESINYENIEVLDNIEVVEQVPTAYNVDTFTCGMFRIVGETVKSLGWFPKNGANAEEHLENILTNGQLTATLEDTKTSRIVAVVYGVRLASHNYTVDARGVVGEDCTFTAIKIGDEAE